HLYNDPAGHCTIGYGHLVHHGACNGSESSEFQAGITQARAEELLRSDAQVAVNAVNTRVTVDPPLTQQEFDALVDFAFNIGVPAFTTSTLLTELNGGGANPGRGDVCTQLRRWVHGSGGVVLPGLVQRREDECNLFNNGNYGPQPKTIFEG